MALKYNFQTLTNGLTLVSVPTQAESVSVLALVHAGSRDETETQHGAAHFLEHFVFKGTKEFPNVNDTTKVIDEVGGEQNAFTSNDFTGFWAKVSSDQWQRAIKVVGQLVSEPILPEGELEKEKGAIIEEINMYEDSHPNKAWTVFEKMLFGESGLGRPILGTQKSIKAMSVDDLKSFRNRWYDPKNVVVVVVGSLPKPEELSKEIENNFSSLSVVSTTSKRIGYGETFTQDSPRVSITKKPTEQAHLVLGVKGISANDHRLYTLAVLDKILGGNMSSRLWNEVREKRGLAYYVRSLYDTHMDQGSVVVRAGVRLKDLAEAVRVTVGELLAMSSSPVSSEELLRGKEGVKGSLKLEMEDTQSIAELVSEDWALMSGKVRTLEEIVAQVDQVTPQDIQKLASELFLHKSLNLSVVGPFDDKMESELTKILEG